MKEITVQIGTQKSIIGIVSEPETLTNLPAVVLLNAGLIHRIGPNRIYVKLARKLAEQGVLALRIDLSGIGDSQSHPDHLPFERSTIDDTIKAMDQLEKMYGIQKFVLVGHCLGAYHSFRTASEDHRVQRIVMINPDGGETEWVEYDRKRKVSQYYQKYYGKKKLFDPGTWKRLFNGEIAVRSVINNFFKDFLWYRVSTLYFKIKQRFLLARTATNSKDYFTIESIIHGLTKIEAQLLLVYSEGATSLERVQGMGGVLKKMRQTGQVRLEVVARSDHTFTLVESQERLFSVILSWLR